MKKAVIFDLGRVIVDIDLACRHENLTSDADQARRLIEKISRDAILLDLNAGRITPEQFHSRLCSDYELKHDFAAFEKIWCGVFRPMPGMEPLLRELVGRVKLGLLSDTEPMHWNYLRSQNPILGIFKQPTLSFNVGAVKPDPRMFLAAAESVDTPPEECFYTDDLLANVEGARRVGMTAVQFENADQLRRDLHSAGIL
jgi:putative hydrolase of the HAD superfamily